VFIVHKEQKKGYAVCMWIFLFALIAPFTPGLDLYLSHLFYSPEHGFYDHFFFIFLFKYGELFGLATGGLVSLAFFLSFMRSQWKKWRKGALVMLLTLVIGAGLITNLGLKEYWGRPRPKQITQFGGALSYRPFWRPNFRPKEITQKSFPSGHVAMGFYFLSLCLVARRYKSPLLFRSGLILTALLGGGLMVGRVAQGGHFFSDVITSPLIMWYVAKGCDWLVFTWGGFGWQARDLKKPDTSQAPENV
jgi:membrane-associated PAP2 superfamily phosphatase